MRRVRAALLRIGGLFRKSAADDAFANELAFHLDAHIQENIAAGMTPEAARRDALLKLGGIAQTTEQVRDRRGLPFLETTLRDIRYAIRILRNAPAFTFAVIPDTRPRDWREHDDVQFCGCNGVPAAQRPEGERVGARLR